MDRKENISAFVEAGFTLIPLRGKIPVATDWVNTPPGTYAEHNLPGNYGVALKAGDLVVDIDPRNFAPGDKPVARLIAAIGAPLKSFTVRTGGGGLHIYLSKPADISVVNSLKEFPGIEFKSSGRQVVGPGSIHPDSGKEYTVEAGTVEEIAPAPQKLLDLIRRQAVPFPDVEATGTKGFVNDAATQGRFASYLQDRAEPSVQGKGGDANAFKVACHGRDLGLPPAITLELMLSLWNPRCSPSWDPEELKAKVVNAYKYASGVVGKDHPAADFDAADFDAVGPAPTPVAQKTELAWDTDRNGQAKKTFQNLLNFFKMDKTGLKGIFGQNEFTGRVEFIAPAPWHAGRMPRYVGVSDTDLKLLKGHLATRYAFEMPISVIEEATTIVAHAARFHPVRDYLNALKWDGRKRLDNWLHDYVGAPDDEYTRACARKTLVAAVARVMHPGAKFDHVLLLEGAQGIGKSTLCAILGEPWAADFPIDPHNKDTIQLLQGKWIVELAEMEVTRRAEQDALKAFISRTVDQARLAYGRTVGEFPRQCIFIGSKNLSGDGTYLKDDSGNRRWWPVKCEPAGGRFDLKGLRFVRDQLFAEAVDQYKNGKEKLFMDTPELEAAANAAAAARFSEHEWTERIAAWAMANKRDFFTSREVYIEAMGGIDKQYDKKSQWAIGSALRQLGFRPTTRRVDGGDHVARGWEPMKRVLVAQPLDTIDGL